MGKFICIEGSNASGKTTQCNLLRQVMASGELRGNVQSFPNYTTVPGRQIRRYLNGEFGDALDVPASLVANLYAFDRVLAKESIENVTIWGELDEFLIADRWTYSNMALLGAQVKALGGDVEEFINTVYREEFIEMRVLVPDLTILLDMPLPAADWLIRHRSGENSADASGKKDVQEGCDAIVQGSYDIYQDLAKRYGWYVVNCVDADGNIRTPESIHQEILGVLKGM